MFHNTICHVHAEVDRKLHWSSKYYSVNWRTTWQQNAKSSPRSIDRSHQSAMMPTNAHVEQKKLITYLQNLSKDDMSSIKPRGLDCLYLTSFSHALDTEKSVLYEATKSPSRDGNHANKCDEKCNIPWWRTGFHSFLVQRSPCWGNRVPHAWAWSFRQRISHLQWWVSVARIIRNQDLW